MTTNVAKCIELCVSMASIHMHASWYNSDKGIDLIGDYLNNSVSSLLTSSLISTGFGIRHRKYN